MKTKDKQSGEFEKFNKVMDGLLAVPRKELQQKLDEEKRLKEKQKRRTTSSASHVSSNAKSRAS
jgi:hypothetical protein